jgi:hypothetical protein
MGEKWSELEYKYLLIFVVWLVKSGGRINIEIGGKNG